MRLSVIIPVLNEEKTISKIIEKVLKQKDVCEIIVVDDGSRDNTPEILKRAQSKLRKNKRQTIKVVIHPQNKGKGAAIRTGITKVSGDFLIIQDADLEYNPEEFGELLKKASSKTVVYGSRILAKNPHAYIRTYLGNVFISAMHNLLFGDKLTDIYTCYKLLPSNIAKELKLQSNGFEIEAEITAKLAKNGIKIIEVPISYKPRSYEKGKKIKAKDALIGAYTLLKIKFSQVKT